MESQKMNRAKKMRDPIEIFCAEEIGILAITMALLINKELTTQGVYRFRELPSKESR